MTCTTTRISILGLLLLGCAQEPTETEEVLPMDGLWQSGDLTYDSNCDDSGGNSADEMSVLDTALLFTVPDYTELSIGDDGAFKFAPETVLDEMVCTLSGGVFDCPDKTDRISGDGLTLIWTRTFAGTFFAEPDANDSSTTNERATEGAFVFSSDITCENGDCGDNVELPCFIESHFSVSHVEDYEGDEWAEL